MSTDTFGDRLRTEREDRGLGFQFVAGILRVDEPLLRALERNDFDVLPDESEMMDLLHAYAEVLEVDADLMIEDYLRERDGWLREVAGPVPGAFRRARAGRPRLSLLLVALVAVVIVLPAAWWVLSRDATGLWSEVPVATQPPRVLSGTATAAAPGEPSSGAPEDSVEEVAVAEPSLSPGPSAVVAAPEPAPPAAGPATDVDPLAPAPAAAEPPESSSASARPDSTTLRIADYGVGTSVENRHLVGRGDRFAEGTRVAFWTRVLGGDGGATIDHIWLREGVVKMRLPLKIGGPSWRTHSTITLRADFAGNWAVEARDNAGRVLARSEFVCVR